MPTPVFRDAARSLIAARSVSDEGNLPAVEVLEGRWRSLGVPTRRLPSPDTPDRDANLLAGPIGPATSDLAPLLLVTHLDTVAPGPREHWRTDPFELTDAGERWHGLGVADVKLDALCKLFAVERILGTKLERPVWFLGTYGEEVGLRGARAFIADPPIPRPAFVLCGEPCGLRLHHAHKGYAMVRVTLRSPSPPARYAATVESVVGRAAHSSTPHLGLNAIDMALERLLTEDGPVVAMTGGSSPNTVPAACDVARGMPGDGPPRVDLRPVLGAVRDLRDAWMQAMASLEPDRDERFTPMAAVGSLTRIDGRDGRLSFVLDGRLLPDHDPELLHARFRASARDVVRAHGLGDDAWELEVLRRASGMSQPKDAPFVKACGEELAALGLDPSPVAKPTSTEGGVFQRWGCETLVFGPTTSIGNAHAANEYAVVDELDRAVDVYERLILRFCAEGRGVGISGALG
jgi:acetylornithine deacetylase/succinyl-diaminopimelate desuccinylase-like protein